MSTIQSNVDYMLVNYNSGLVWAVEGEDTNPGTSVVQYSWVIDPNQYNQRWNFESVSGGGWRIRTTPDFSATPLYAAIDQGRNLNDNDAGVNVYPLQGLTRAVWSLSNDEVGEWITIKNVDSGKCLVIRGESTDNDKFVVQYDCIAQAGQQWVILPYISGMTP